jgi:hypothetical protein
MGRGEIDGVRVVWSDEPDGTNPRGRYEGTLVFGVGARDEGLDQLGLTQFALALVLDTVSTEVDHTLGIVDTAVTATGTPEEVAAQLGEVCAVIRDVPVTRIADSARMAAVAQGLYPGDRAADMSLDDDVCRDPWAALVSRPPGPKCSSMACSRCRAPRTTPRSAAK